MTDEFLRPTRAQEPPGRGVCPQTRTAIVGRGRLGSAFIDADSSALDWAIGAGLGDGERSRPAEGIGPEGVAEVRVFLIADVRDYTRFTQERGDEAAARLAIAFAAIVREGIATRGGSLLDLPGDGAVAVFTSARQALRAAVELQARFQDELERDPELPLRVGIGIDSGEAVRVEEGFRGRALNLASRLCSLARPGEVIASESVVHLAGKLADLRYVDGGKAHLKGIPEPVHVVRVADCERPAHDGGAGPVRTKLLSWRLLVPVCLVAAATAGAVVLLTTRGPSGSATPPPSASTSNSTGSRSSTMGNSAGDGSKMGQHMGSSAPSASSSPKERLTALVADESWTCRTAPTVTGAVETRLCSTRVPARLQVSVFGTRAGADRAYRALLGRAGVTAGSGACSRNEWGGELEWFHGPGEPGGRVFCYLSEATQRSYIVWTSVAGTKLLLRAELDSLRHRDLFFWWVGIRHEIV